MADDLDQGARREPVPSSIDDLIDQAWAAQEQALIDQVTHNVHAQMAGLRAGHQANLLPVAEGVKVVIDMEFVRAR